jgi:predicted glycogen debranching enzyme
VPSPIVAGHEWLEADGLGGFASGTVGLVRTRRYHALLLAARTPPTGRLVLVNGFDAWVETRAGRFAISTQRYADETLHPDGAHRLSSFEHSPWPRWSFTLPDGVRVEQELLALHGEPVVCLSWRVIGTEGPVALELRPFLSGRDSHALQRENEVLRFDAEARGDCVTWRCYDSLPAVSALANAAYRHEPHWYRGFLYAEERERGLDHLEDLASPGTFRYEAGAREAVLLLGVSEALARVAHGRDAFAVAHEIRSQERRRREAFASPLHVAADAYLVRRGAGRTIVAGYPWFCDWGRDTFIAMRGLCLAAGRLAEAREILLEWSQAVSRGMLPNRFPDDGAAPEYNSVDAGLWFVVVVHELLLAAGAGRLALTGPQRERLSAAMLEVVRGYAEGTRHGIRADSDGLLQAGEPGVQLTWMDAKVGDWVVTPRVGKPVEIQALWLNALRIVSPLAPECGAAYERGLRSFGERFWNEAAGALYDVVDDGGVRGAVDARFRPNQILAVGGLPFAILEGERARRVVEAVEARLVTPLGLRTLAREEQGYAPRYEGGVGERDGAYHQGTVWPWLLGPFVEAWLRVRGGSLEARREARESFVLPLLRHLDEAGLGHVSEIADGDAPHAPRGCPFQAWSLGELLRLELSVLGS